MRSHLRMICRALGTAALVCAAGWLAAGHARFETAAQASAAEQPPPPPPPPPPPAAKPGAKPAEKAPTTPAPEKTAAEKPAVEPAPPPPPPPPPAGKPGEKPAAKPAATPSTKVAAKPGEKGQPRPNQCLDCHGNPDVWEGPTLRLHVTDKHIAGDLHWQKGLRCADCHGGNPATDKVNEAHAEEDGFRRLRAVADPIKPPDPVKVVELCGSCHADIERMRPFNPKARVDQLREYWTSGHGRRLKESQDGAVATCVSCHDRAHGNASDKERHGVRAVAELDSPVYPKNVAKTCAKCHSDAKLMAGRTYHGRPIGHSQHEEWSQSVHAESLLKKGDLSAATCNDCHGNHGALPPDVDSVANACGTCHGKIAGLFANTRMRHAFEKVGLPGCAACHGNHGIHHPTVEMLGMEKGAVCVSCHEQQKHGATVAGGETARKLRADIDGLRKQIEEAEVTIKEADKWGMPIPGPQSDPRSDVRLHLRKATDALSGARVEIHRFALEPVEKLLATGQDAVAEVQASADSAIYQRYARRLWLAGTLAPIGLVILVLVLYVRRMPVPSVAAPEEHPSSEG